MGSGEEELGIGGGCEGDIVGEVLRDIEGDEAIDADGFVGVGMGAEGFVECESLAGEAVDAVLDSGAGSSEEASEGTDAHGGAEEQFDFWVGECAFGEVIKAEGLGREVLAAGAAAEAPDLAEGFGHIEASGDEPAFCGSVLMIDAVGVWAEMEMMHESLLSL